MNDKDCLDKLVEAIDKLEATTERMGKTVDKIIDYCTIVSLIMFITVIVVIVF